MLHTSPPARSALLLALASAIPACTSLDPTPDFQQAGAIAEPRLEPGIELAGVLEQRPEDAPSCWDGETPLDTQVAVRAAFQRDVSIRIAMEEVALRRAELAQADRAPNPVVNVGVGFAIDGMSGAPALVEVLQQLSWLWKRPHMVDAADARRRQAILTAAQRAVDLSANVRTAHAIALEAQRRVELDIHYSQTTQGTLDLVRRIAEVGEQSQIDVDRALLQHAEAHAALQSSRRSLRSAKLSLLGAMGMPEHDTDWTLAGEFDTSTPVPEENELIERAHTVRLDVAVATEGISAAMAESELAGTRRYPDLGVGLGWRESFSGRRGLVPGASISLPFFDDGSPALAGAEANLRIAILNLLRVQRSAIEETRSNLEAWQRSRQQASLYQETVMQPAIEAQELSSLAYGEGVIDLTVLLLAQRNRIEAERRMLGFQAAATTDLVALERSVGGSFDIPLDAPIAQEESVEEETS